LGATEQTRELGAQLIGLYAIPFEVSSLLLLAALIGAVVLAKSEREPEAEAPVLAMAEEVGAEL
jgi:NADH-quinone oxidoreductase subunit J